MKWKLTLFYIFGEVNEQFIIIIKIPFYHIRTLFKKLITIYILKITKLVYENQLLQNFFSKTYIDFLSSSLFLSTQFLKKMWKTKEKQNM